MKNRLLSQDAHMLCDMLGYVSWNGYFRVLISSNIQQDVMFLLSLCCFMMGANNPIMAWWSHSFIFTFHSLIIIIMRTNLIWRYWTSKILVRYILSSVCLRLSQFFHIIIIKSKVWPICHCLGWYMLYVSLYSYVVWWYIHALTTHVEKLLQPHWGINIDTENIYCWPWFLYQLCNAIVRFISQYHEELSDTFFLYNHFCHLLCSCRSHHSHGWKVRANWKHNKCRKISNIRCTKSPNLNVSRLVLQLSLHNPMKPGVKSRMKM